MMHLTGWKYMSYCSSLIARAYTAYRIEIRSQRAAPEVFSWNGRYGSKI
jgi:hypothetical protein